MDWRGRNVLVTGGGGFIGSHLCERLLGLGACVRGMIHGDATRDQGYLHGMMKTFPETLTVVGGDLGDEAFIRECVEGIDTVFHLAAVTSVAYSYTHRKETMMTNVIGTLNLCEAVRSAGIRRMVHLSSAGVYGDAVDGAPIQEHHPVHGCNPYTAGKLGGDFVAESYYRSFGIPMTTARLFNTYGPRMGAYLIMPTIIRQLLKGNTLQLGDLTPTRNFTYVDDIVRALQLMAERETVIGETIHFGSPVAISMAYLVERISAMMNKTVDIQCDAERLRPQKSEIFTVVADCSKAKSLLQWEPQVGLDEGLKKTIEWIAAGGYEKVQ